MLRYLDFPPTPAADATAVSAVDRDQLVTSMLIVPAPATRRAPYWQIWLGLQQIHRYVVLDIVRRGICCGQLVATAVSSFAPVSPERCVVDLSARVLVRDVFKLVHDYALDCFVFESLAGRGRRYWISTVLKRFEKSGVVLAGSSAVVDKFLEQQGGPIIPGHFLAPREVRPLAILRRPRLPSYIHGTGFRELMYPFYDSADAKDEDPHAKWCLSSSPVPTMVHRLPKLIPVYWDTSPPSPLPLALTSF